MTCPHSDYMTPDTCDLCTTGPVTETHRTRTEPLPKPLGPVTTARRPGHCTGCNLPIHPNQLIQAASDGVWLHRGCGT